MVFENVSLEKRGDIVFLLLLYGSYMYVNMHVMYMYTIYQRVLINDIY